MAGLFIGSLIVDALVPIIGIAWKHHNDEKHKPHPATSDNTPQTNGDDTGYVFETPCLSPEMIMYSLGKRATSPVETPKPKRQDRRLRDGREVVHTGPSYKADWCRDFSGIQRTMVNPVTGRIIGYKGIPRKRRLSPTSKYSSFWRDQKYHKTSFHAARSPGVWDSARR